MKTIPLGEILKQCAALPLTCEFAEQGGYDCMTSAFYLKAQDGPIVADVDLGSFGQKSCGSLADALPKAQATAAYLTHAANVLPDLTEALRVALEYMERDGLASNGPCIVARHALSLATNVPTP